MKRIFNVLLFVGFLVPPLAVADQLVLANLKQSPASFSVQPMLMFLPLTVDSRVNEAEIPLSDQDVAKLKSEVVRELRKRRAIVIEPSWRSSGSFDTNALVLKTRVHQAGCKAEGKKWLCSVRANVRTVYGEQVKNNFIGVSTSLARRGSENEAISDAEYERIALMTIDKFSSEYARLIEQRMQSLQP